MVRHGIVTGLPGARSWPGASVVQLPHAAEDGDRAPHTFLPTLRRGPSGARFRSQGQHAERRGTRRSPGVWPFGRHAHTDASATAAKPAPTPAG